MLRTLYGSVSSTRHALDGVAVVSEIIASRNPKEAASRLAGIIQAFRAEFAIVQGWTFESKLYGQNDAPPTTDEILDRVVKLMAKIKELGPLVHQVWMQPLVDIKCSDISWSDHQQRCCHSIR